MKYDSKVAGLEARTQGQPQAQPQQPQQ
jgi:hypothetical protein